MKSARESVKVQVMGKEFAVACDINEKATLLNSTAFLNEQISQIQNHGKIVGNDRIAIMVAINLASELLDLREEQASSANLSQEIDKLISRVDEEMNKA